MHFSYSCHKWRKCTDYRDKAGEYYCFSTVLIVEMPRFVKMLLLHKPHLHRIQFAAGMAPDPVVHSIAQYCVCLKQRYQPKRIESAKCGYCPRGKKKRVPWKKWHCHNSGF